MKLKARKDIEAPLAETFAVLSDFAAFERAAMRQGAVVERLEGPAENRVGNRWRVLFDFRGRRREVVSRLSTHDAPHAFAFDGESANFLLALEVGLIQLSRNHTRVTVECEVRPRSFSGRLLLQTLKLARGRVEARFAMRIDQLGTQIQRRLREGRRRD